MIEQRKYITIPEDQRVAKSKLTYGHRVALGRLFSQGKSNAAVCREAIRILHPDVEHVNICRENMEYVNSIYEAISWWIEQEKKFLKYEPTAEEKSAGVARVSEMGARGTATSIGKDYGITPSKVFDWAYGDVFSVLELDVRKAMFQRRLHEQRERKRKQQPKGRRR